MDITGRKYYLALWKFRNQENFAEYKDAKVKAKEAIRQAKSKVYQEVCES